MSNSEGDSFCERMRKATREIHTISDALVNAKLAFGLFNDTIWADGLLAFYEIFQYLECAMVRWKDTQIGLFMIDELRRTEAFKQDLDFYLGKEWIKDYSPRDSVIKYLSHLEKVENKNPILLIAYIYHLYMGLLSGGIILHKKRQLRQKILPLGEKQVNGNNVTNFGKNNVYKLKQHMKDTLNEIAESLDEDTKTKLIEESKLVFALNNKVIKSIKGVSSIIYKQSLYLIILIPLITFALFISFD